MQEFDPEPEADNSGGECDRDGCVCETNDWAELENLIEEG